MIIISVICSTVNAINSNTSDTVQNRYGRSQFPHLWTSLLFAFLGNYSIPITRSLLIAGDNSLVSNCLVFFGLIVLVGLRKSLLTVTTVFEKFQLQFHRLYLVKFLFCLFSVFICYHLW